MLLRNFAFLSLGFAFEALIIGFIALGGLPFGEACAREYYSLCAVLNLGPAERQSLLISLASFLDGQAGAFLEMFFLKDAGLLVMLRLKALAYFVPLGVAVLLGIFSMAMLLRSFLVWKHQSFVSLDGFSRLMLFILSLSLAPAFLQTVYPDVRVIYALAALSCAALGVRFMLLTGLNAS